MLRRARTYIAIVRLGHAARLLLGGLPRPEDITVEELIDVFLLGGPPSLPRTVRVGRSVLQDGKIKIQHMGGYEHFEPADGPQELGSGTAMTYQWTLRTFIAE
jgi:Family of unknown function (DUF5988)